jgi:hypothetical protein
MHQTILTFLFAYSIAASAAVAFAVANRYDEEVPLKELPRFVVRAIERRFPDARLLSADKEISNGELLFEVTIRTRSYKKEVQVTPAGMIQRIRNGAD